MLLSDDIFIQFGLESHGLGDSQSPWDKPFFSLLCNDLITKLDTFITDVNRGAGDEFPYFILTLPQKEQCKTVP